MDILALIFGNNIRRPNDSSIFLKYSYVQQRNLDMHDRFMPRYSPPTKRYPVLNGKTGLFMQMLQLHINKNGSV